MSEAIVCDQCGKTEAKDSYIFEWYVVERIGIEYVLRGQAQPPFHFCSWSCMAEYATMRADIPASV